MKSIAALQPESGVPPRITQHAIWRFATRVDGLDVPRFHPWTRNEYKSFARRIRRRIPFSRVLEQKEIAVFARARTPRPQNHARERHRDPYYLTRDFGTYLFCEDDGLCLVIEANTVITVFVATSEQFDLLERARAGPPNSQPPDEPEEPPPEDPFKRLQDAWKAYEDSRDGLHPLPAAQPIEILLVEPNPAGSPVEGGAGLSPVFHVLERLAVTDSSVDIHVDPRLPTMHADLHAILEDRGMISTFPSEFTTAGFESSGLRAREALSVRQLLRRRPDGYRLFICTKMTFEGIVGVANKMYCDHLPPSRIPIIPPMVCHISPNAANLAQRLTWTTLNVP